MAARPFPKRNRLAPDAYANRENAFHVVIRAAVDTTPFRGAVGVAVWNAIDREFARPNVDLRVACLMPDHFHAIVKPAERSIVQWVDGFKSYATHVVRPYTRRPALWQPGFYDRHLRNEREYEEAAFYVMNNPVEAGLVSSIEDWPWTRG